MLPKNTEIEEALAEYQRLFGGDSHVEALYAQRQVALEAMRSCSEFEPRLVGAVLSGTATEHSDVQLHLFADAPRAVAIKLMDAGHSARSDRAAREDERGARARLPGLRFEIDDQPIEATVFPTDGIRQAPVSPVDGKPMRRADVERSSSSCSRLSARSQASASRSRRSRAASGPV